MSAQDTSLGRLEWFVAQPASKALHPGLVDDVAALISELKAAREERDELARKVFVPGVRRCAKCGLRLVTSTLHVGDGRVSANNEPQDCPNECGPMWPLTEREAGNDLCDRLDAATERAQAAEAQRDRALSEKAELVEALKALVALFDDYRESDLSHSDAHSILVRYPVWDHARAAIAAAEPQP